MALTLAEEYGRLKAELDELRSQEDLFLGETEREVLNENISRIQNRIAEIRDYHMKAEDLAYKHMNINRTLYKYDYYLAELADILAIGIPVIDLDSTVDELTQAQIQEERFLEIVAEARGLKAKDIRRSFEREEDKMGAMKRYYRVLEDDARKLRTERDDVYFELMDLKVGVMGIGERDEDFPIDDGEEEEFPIDDREGQENPIDDEQAREGGLGDIEFPGEMEYDDFESEQDNKDERVEQVEQDVREIADARALRDMVAQRKDKWEKISELKGVKLMPGKELRDNKKQIKTLQEKLNAEDAFLRDYVHEFSKNPEYEKSEELLELIGIRDEKRDEKDGTKGTTLVKTTIKQHLDPILKIEEELEKDSLSDEERKKLIKERAKKIKRLGKKWLFKLRIDKVTAEIEALKAQLNDPNLSPEDRDKIMEQLNTKSKYLSDLMAKYAKILDDIAELISGEVEKKVLERNGVNSLEELQEKKEKLINAASHQRDEEKEENDNRGTSRNGGIVTGERHEENPIAPETENEVGVGSGHSSGVGNLQPGGLVGGSVGDTSSNLPAKKPTFKERITNMFKKKEKEEEKVTDWENGGNVIFSEKIEYDFASQYAMMQPPRVEGENFYFTRERDGNVEYVAMPLADIVCNKKALLEEIKRLQEEHKGRDYIREGRADNRGLFERLEARSAEEILEDKNSPSEDFRNKSARAIANHLLGASRGRERELRMLNAICQLRAAHLTKEVDEAMYGTAEFQFSPGIQLEGKKMTFVPLDRTSDNFKGIVGRLKGHTPVLDGILQERHSPDFLGEDIEEFGADPDDEMLSLEDLDLGRFERGRREAGLSFEDEQEEFDFEAGLGDEDELEEFDFEAGLGDEDEEWINFFDDKYAPNIPEETIIQIGEHEQQEALVSAEENIGKDEDIFIPLLTEDGKVLDEKGNVIMEPNSDNGLSERARRTRAALGGEDFEDVNRRRRLPPREQPHQSRRRSYTVPAPKNWSGPRYNGKGGAPKLNGGAPVLNGGRPEIPEREEAVVAPRRRNRSRRQDRDEM